VLSIGEMRKAQIDIDSGDKSHMVGYQVEKVPNQPAKRV
jgi:hypothetical protein